MELSDQINRFLTWLAQCHVKLLIKLRGDYQGSDDYGNQYYLEKSPRRGRPVRRWVVYNGDPEASKVPPEWFGWLHYTADQPEPSSPYPWSKPHQPNVSGTSHSYRPQGHFLRQGKRPRATGDYEPWSPP